MSDQPTHDPLSRELRTWRVAPRRNPNFRTETWARIEAHRRDLELGWGTYLRRHGAAWLTVFLFVAIGAGWGGHAVGAHRNNDAREAILTTYVAAIDVKAALADRP